MEERKHSYNEKELLQIIGARENNLKNVSLSIPRNLLVVITGISGSGKSSLAFDTIFAEGQRRYMESFSSYARTFLGNFKRPDIDKIEGLSPVISIEQKSTSRSSRSTVGTITEIYDFLRLLFARSAEAYSYHTGEKMIKHTKEEIQEIILQKYKGKKIILLAPLVRGRKGAYREMMEKLRSKGYLHIRIDGKMRELSDNIQISRYQTHDIEVVVDKLVLSSDLDMHRFENSLTEVLKIGKGILIVYDVVENTYKYFSKMLMCPTTGIAYDEPAPNLFSFNSGYGACSICTGLGEVETIDIDSLEKEGEKSLIQTFKPLIDLNKTHIYEAILQIFKKNKLDINTSCKNIPLKTKNSLFYGEKEDHASTPYSFFEFSGIIPFIMSCWREGDYYTRKRIQPFTLKNTCPNCKGDRLCKEALWYKIDNKNITELCKWNLQELSEWLLEAESRFTDRQKLISKDVLKQVRKRLNLVNELGLSYLSLFRPVSTLSGGELQRIRLATQIGTQLVGVLYILDEPSIGLHPRDNLKLIHSLRELRDLGNSVIVVEHDKEMMLASDFIIDIGPGAGKHGGEIVAHSMTQDLLRNTDSLTTKYLLGEKNIPIPLERRKTEKKIVLKKAQGNNLKNIDVTFPIGAFICVTGVSGSGKSTLIHQTLYPILANHLYKEIRNPMKFGSITGLEWVDKVIQIDQSPIGRTPRSTPATYTNVFTLIRTLFVSLPESKIRGFKPGRFSFNIKGGRCETCKGTGRRMIEMEFLSDLYVDCEDCKGKRYNRETLEVRYKGKSIADVLEMTVTEALDFFEKHPKIYNILKTLNDVGLGYVSLGQHSTSLSGGEAQRVRISSELAKKQTGKTFYILDEPTTGLHFQDVQLLIDILNQLVKKNNTVVVIEHNMDVIKTADHIIDLGPEGGGEGGYIVTEGTPEEVAKEKKGYTGIFLKKELEA